MRKKLGCPDKAPVQKMEQAFTGSSLALISSVLALFLCYFGVRFMVDFLNFIEANADGNSFIAYSDQGVYIVQGSLAVLSIFFIFSRK